MLAHQAMQLFNEICVFLFYLVQRKAVSPEQKHPVPKRGAHRRYLLIASIRVQKCVHCAFGSVCDMLKGGNKELFILQETIGLRQHVLSSCQMLLCLAENIMGIRKRWLR